MAKKNLTYNEIVNDCAAYDGSSHLETVEGIISLADELKELDASSQAFEITPEGGAVINIVPNDCRYLNYHIEGKPRCEIGHSVQWNYEEGGVRRCFAYTSCTDKGVNLCKDRERC